MAALSLTVAQCGPGTWTLNSERLWNEVKVELQNQVGQPSRGQDAGSSEYQTFMAFKRI